MKQSARFAELGIDHASPMQGGLVRVTAKHIVDGRAARQDSGDDGKKTENYQTGHYQPIARADLFHVTTSLDHPGDKVRLIAKGR